MASQQSTVDFIEEQAAQAGDVSTRKMFGEYALFCDGKMVALICDDQLFVKPTKAGRAHIGDPTEEPPYKGAKPCFLIPGDNGKTPIGWPKSLKCPPPNCRCPRRKSRVLVRERLRLHE